MPNGSDDLAKARPTGGPFCVPPPRTFFLTGATATGKTGLAVALARETGAEIVGADAFQIYRGLPILTAQPSQEEMGDVPHHLIGEISLGEEMDAARFQTFALNRIESILRKGRPVIVVGGTGLYVKTLTHGLSGGPKSDPGLRAMLEAMELPQLQERLRGLDSAAAEAVDMANPRRVTRAIEIIVQTGLPLSAARGAWDRNDVPVCGVHLVREREDLRARIRHRTREMFAAGVVEEAGHVLAASKLSQSASQVLGLREIERVLDGEMTRGQAEEAIATATAQYAKRQVTWFKAQGCFNTLVAEDDSARLLAELLSRFNAVP